MFSPVWTARKLVDEYVKTRPKDKDEHADVCINPRELSYGGAVRIFSLTSPMMCLCLLWDSICGLLQPSILAARMWICPEPVWVDHVFDRSHQSITVIGLPCVPLLPNERRDSLKGHGWGTIKDGINRTPVQTKLKRHVTSSLCG